MRTQVIFPEHGPLPRMRKERGVRVSQPLRIYTSFKGSCGSEAISSIEEEALMRFLIVLETEWTFHTVMDVSLLGALWKSVALLSFVLLCDGCVLTWLFLEISCSYVLVSK